MPIRLDKLEDLADRKGPLHLALGVFDGVHVGHQSVIASAVNAAALALDGGEAFVVTFSPHPIQVIAPSKAPSSLLATVNEKAAIVKALGVDGLLVIEFTPEFAKTGAEEFVGHLTQGAIASISVGEDWRFGSKRLGDVEMLRKMGDLRGFQLHAISPVMWDGERISSTRIRQAIRDGNFDAVEKMLGRSYEIAGFVVEGRKLGRELGFPTANIRLGDLEVPKDGVWAVTVNDGMKGVANLGVRPTVAGEERLLEVHLLDFSGDLYGRTLRIRFESFIRCEKKFASLAELKAQISRDVLKAEEELRL